MRVLWITNYPIAAHRKQLGAMSAQGGGWMDAAFELLTQLPDVELGLASVYSCANIIIHEVNGIKMYTVPNDVKHGLYQYNKKENIDLWTQISSDFKPDVLHIWGTEMAHSLCALCAMPQVPAVVYLQGLMAQIYNHDNSGIDLATKVKYTTIRDIIENKGIHINNVFEAKRVAIEREIIKRANNVILENEWAEINCQVISGRCRVFRSLLPINKIFANYNWSYGKAVPNTIFTVAGGYPIKGHHILLKALAIIKERYPDVKLIIPGYNPLNDDTGLRRMLPHGYTKYVRSLIKKCGITENIQFTGKITADEMARYMSESRVFVMPSAIENHSSTLIEAMMVGAPCVSSYVGGILDYFKNGVNGFMYRYDEPETLAGLIMKLFEDKELSERIGENAKVVTRQARLSINMADDFIKIYHSVVIK